MSGWSPPSREELEVERRADIASPHMQIEWAPGKALSAAVGAGVAVPTAPTAAMASLFSHIMR